MTPSFGLEIGDGVASNISPVGDRAPPNLGVSIPASYLAGVVVGDDLRVDGVVVGHGLGLSLVSRAVVVR